jgi:surface polysaccharide O-acyltransferase-like enzyme
MNKQHKEVVNNRVIYLDVIRIVATFGVIALHVFATEYYSVVGSLNWFISVIGDSLVRWSVPLFVMLSGALFLQPTKEISYTILFKKYIPRLLLTYAFWSLSYSAIRTTRHLILGQKLELSLLFPHFHLWYLPMLIGIYLLIPIIRKISIDKKIMKYALVLWVIYLIGCFCDFYKIPQIGVLFKINLIVGYAGYFLLGYYISECKISKKQTLYIFLVGLIGAIVCLSGNIITSYHFGVSQSKFLDNLGPAVIAMSLSLFTLIKQVTQKIEHKLIRFIEYIRKDLFGIYLTHGIWLLVVNIPLFRNLCNQLISLPIIIILIFVLSLYTTKLIRQIPLLRKSVE